MRVGIIIGRIGGIDGVALETEKWIDVLEKLGHEIYIITGNLSNDIKNVTIIPEMEFHHPLTVREQDDAFYKQRVKEETLVKRIEHHSTQIEHGILTWIVKNKIDIILSENSSALPCHLAMGLAIKNVVEKTGIACVTHDHDFPWERGERYKTKYSFVRKIIKDCFPLKIPHVKHAVINLAAQKTLKEKFNLESHVVPNVMDFDKPYGLKDKFNSTVLKSLNLSESDIPMFQITRIVRRKGIEVAIQLLHELDDPRVKLVITGCVTDDHNADYYGELVDLVDELQLDDRVLFASKIFNNERMVGKHLASDISESKLLSSDYKKRVYSLSDAYAYAKGCTYFSTYEGFGNAFVECVLAKKPIWVNDYQPVYTPDIGSKGFETVMLSDNKLTAQSISQIKDTLFDDKKSQEIVEHNYALGKEHFSYQVLERHLEHLFNES